VNSYRIVATKRFLRRLKELDRKIRERVLRAIEEIAEKPYIGSTLVFNGKRLYKYRVGNYRVVYEVFFSTLFFRMVVGLPLILPLLGFVLIYASFLEKGREAFTYG